MGKKNIFFTAQWVNERLIYCLMSCHGQETYFFTAQWGNDGPIYCLMGRHGQELPKIQ